MNDDYGLHAISGKCSLGNSAKVGFGMA